MQNTWEFSFTDQAESRKNNNFIQQRQNSHPFKYKFMHLSKTKQIGKMRSDL
jgi:hypothetical protein